MWVGGSVGRSWPGPQTTPPPPGSLSNSLCRPVGPLNGFVNTYGAPRSKIDLAQLEKGELFCALWASVGGNEHSSHDQKMAQVPANAGSAVANPPKIFFFWFRPPNKQEGGAPTAAKRPLERVMAIHMWYVHGTCVLLNIDV